MDWVRCPGSTAIGVWSRIDSDTSYTPFTSVDVPRDRLATRQVVVVIRSLDTVLGLILAVR